MSRETEQIISRNYLKKIFQNQNAIQEAYPRYIDSSINIRDDNIRIDRKEGMVLNAAGLNQQLIRLVSPTERDEESWNFRIYKQEGRGLNIADGLNRSALFLQDGGNVGIGTENPQGRLHVNGLMSMEAMIGTYDTGYIDADADWHPTGIRGITHGIHAFEVMAHINDLEDDRYSLARCVALLEFGRKQVQAKVKHQAASSRWLWGKFWNQIQFRWANANKKSREGKSYQLEVRSRTHFGLQEDEESCKQIFYRVTQLL